MMRSTVRRLSLFVALAVATLGAVPSAAANRHCAPFCAPVVPLAIAENAVLVATVGFVSMTLLAAVFHLDFNRSG